MIRCRKEHKISGVASSPHYRVELGPEHPLRRRRENYIRGHRKGITGEKVVPGVTSIGTFGRSVITERENGNPGRVKRSGRIL